MSNQVDLKNESQSASAESAGHQAGDQQEDRLLQLLERHRQRGAG